MIINETNTFNASIHTLIGVVSSTLILFVCAFDTQNAHSTWINERIIIIKGKKETTNEEMHMYAMKYTIIMKKKEKRISLIHTDVYLFIECHQWCVFLNVVVCCIFSP